VIVLVEGFGPDAIGLARFLAAEGETVRIAAPEPEPREATELRRLGIAVEPNANLDASPGPADVAYVDPWTPETADRIERLRAQGTRVTCLGQLLLERWEGMTVGITGTAGKTTTTALTAQILRAAGVAVAVSSGARAANLWPTADLLGALGIANRTLLLELTSSHLAFMDVSPTTAAITSFWPDHVELHGSLDRYRTAKEAIVRYQRPGDLVVVNADDGAAAAFANLTPATRFQFSCRRPVENGAYLDSAGRLVLVRGGERTPVGSPLDPTAHKANAVAAAAIATALDVDPDAIDEGLRSSLLPPWRASPAGTLAGLPVVDDGMAATPSKTAALLRHQPDRSVVLVAGGLNHAGGGLVHAAPEEAELLERACDEIARAAVAVIVFGEAAPRLVPLLERRRVETVTVDDLQAAVVVAAREAAARGEPQTVVFSPLFPVSLEDRARFRSLLDDEAP